MGNDLVVSTSGTYRGEEPSNWPSIQFMNKVEGGLLVNNEDTESSCQWVVTGANAAPDMSKKGRGEGKGAKLLSTTASYHDEWEVRLNRGIFDKENESGWKENTQKNDSGMVWRHPGSGVRLSGLFLFSFVFVFRRSTSHRGAVVSPPGQRSESNKKNNKQRTAHFIFYFFFSS